MFAKIFSWIVGTRNQRVVNRYRRIVEKINALEPEFQAIPDSELASKTVEFKARLAKGHTLDQILPEAFALVREGAKRTIGQRHYDVQLIGGIALHHGSIAEMKTGEGKTLVATLALYLNALEEKGCHLITVNDYLAKRDAEWMGPVLKILGLEVAFLQNNLEDEDRQKAYKADITYGTNSEFGFDYLRDNMKLDTADMCQRRHHFAIVDEVDSILIDEARTPLIISGPAEKVTEIYTTVDRAVAKLGKDCFDLDEKAFNVMLTETGVDRIQELLRVENLYSPENILLLHHVNQALRAHSLYKRDVQYLVTDDGQVMIIDEFTGRVLSGRRYSDGLHQAIEAKEGVEIERENQTMATITLQNYFRLYKKLAGMTGTASTDAHEFHKTYKLSVVSIPTNQPVIRVDEDDKIFLSAEEKYSAVTTDIVQTNKRGQPVLVGTGSVEASEHVSLLLRRLGVEHEVLNAKNHAREAEIVKFAGHKSKVTISTSMAGRGTDIRLGEGVIELGGLRVIGTERQENRRVDDQLRGRSGRQGDPGSTIFYISLEDDLMRIFGGDRTKGYMERYAGMEKGESIEGSWINKFVAANQEKLEHRNFDRRKQLLEYDDVMNQQRTVVYKYRENSMEGLSDNGGTIKNSQKLDQLISDMIYDVVEFATDQYLSTGKAEGQPVSALFERLNDIFDDAAEATVPVKQRDDFVQAVAEKYRLHLKELEGQWPEDFAIRTKRWVVLQTIDYGWKTHLQNLDHLLEGIGLRGQAGKNPIYEYKRESFDEFTSMMRNVKLEIVQKLFRIRLNETSRQALDRLKAERDLEIEQTKTNAQEEAAQECQQVRRKCDKVGRNEACSCGSTKKYKHCCGRTS